jgi:PhoPQ-activated pathogenicity-related protein
MSKLIVVTYSFLILIQSFNINIEDISKINALLEHAKYHKEVYGDTFLNFISEHYGNQMTEHENKHKGHENLPFKDPHHMLCHLNTAFILTPYIIYTVNNQVFTEKPISFFYKEPFSSFEKPSVFQPPKIA